MVQNILENGLEIKNMDMVFNNGQMVRDMKVNGNTIKHLEKENFGILMGMFLKVTG